MTLLRQRPRVIAGRPVLLGLDSALRRVGTYVTASIATASRSGRSRLAAFAAAAVVATGVVATAGSAFAATLPSTTGWYQIPNTKLQTVCPANGFGGTTFNFSEMCNKVVASWNSAVMDTTRNRLIVWGGGHNDYAGNEMYAVNLSDLTIQRLTNPSTPTNWNGLCNVTTLSDGNPNSRHTYDGIAYLPSLDKMFVFGGSPTCANGGLSNDTWLFDFPTMKWQKKSPAGTIPAAWPGIVSALDPSTGKVLVHDESRLYAYDPVNDRYDVLATNSSGIDYHMTGAFDPKRRRFVIVGGNQAWMYDLNVTPIVRKPLSTAGASAIAVAAYPGLAYDPASDRIVAWAGGDTVYSLDTQAGTWGSTTYPGGPGPAQGNGTFKRWNYSASAGAFVVVNAMGQNAYALRLSGTPPPPATTDTIPDAFGFTAQTGVALGATVTSSPITVAGINAAAPIAVSGGSYSINGGSYVTTAGTVTAGSTVTVRVTASSANSTQSCASVTIGGVSGSFCVTTLAASGGGGGTTGGTTGGGSGTTGTTGTGTASFSLTASAAQTMAPFTVGLGFKKGDMTSPVLDITDYQVAVMRRWNDGSVKHAIASGHVTLAAGTAKTINVTNSTATRTAANLTAASIATANPQASIAFGSYGTVNLSSLLASPFRTFVAGPEMVEAHYRSAVGSDPSLVAWFHVRLYKNGKVWVRATAENGYLDVASPDKSYAPVVTIGGAQVFNNGGSALTHYGHTRWTQEAWIGGDPQVVPRHDTAYLKATKLVPNYLAASADATILSGLYQSYAPNQNGNWTVSMGDTGYQDQIGLLPKWDALYVTSGGDARAWRSVQANAKALNSYPIGWNDSVTKLPVKPSDRASWSLDGANGGGATGYGAGGRSWEIAHHGSGGYLAYLISGDFFHLETMQNQSAMAYLMAGSVDWSKSPAGTNLGTARRLNGQTRGYAWALRTLSQYTGIAPSNDTLANDYAALLAGNMTALKTLKDTVVPAGTGYIYEYNVNLYGTGLVAPWQQHFFMQALGMGSDLEPLADMTNYIAVRDYMYRGIVGILGDSTGYCFTQAAAYNLKSNDGAGGNNPNAWYKTWAQIYAGTFSPAPACGNTLAGTSGGDPASAATGYWGNLIPAIAYAVEHGATGAAASWARLTGATNWNTVLASGLDKVPTWGVTPRSVSTVTPPPPPPPVVTDTVPDAFAFTFVNNVALATSITSNAITIAGINAAAPIAISGGTYSVNGGAFTATAGTVQNGNTVAVRLTSAAIGSTQACATLTVGGVAAQFCATTLVPPVVVVPDTTPDTFAFTSRGSVAMNAIIVSNAITVTGINAPAAISVTGGTYSIAGGAWTSAAGVVNAGSTVAVRVTSAGTKATQTCATLKIGGVSAPFCVTTTRNRLTLKDGGGTAAASGNGLSASTASTTGSRMEIGMSDTAVDDVTPAALDIDGDGIVDPVRDGLLLMRYMMQRTGDALIGGAVSEGATRTTEDALVDYLDALQAELDIDGDGNIDASTDGMLVLRYLGGLRGDLLIEAAIAPGATRATAVEIELRLATLTQPQER